MKLSGMNYLFIHTINIATGLDSVSTRIKIFVVQIMNTIILIELLIQVTPSTKGSTFNSHNNLMS